MMFGGANARAMWRAQNHRATKPSLRAVAEPGRVVHQLIYAGIQESHELDLANRFEPLRRHAHAESPDQNFRQRRVENALGAEALLQASGCAEDGLAVWRRDGRTSFRADAGRFAYAGQRKDIEDLNA
jgi:hypothetical protein